MRKSFSWQRWLIGAIVIVLMLTTIQLRRAGSEPEPTAIDLSSFTSEGIDGAIRILWTTETEFNVAGYQIERGTSETGAFAIIPVIFEGATQTFIPAQALVPSDGADYLTVDEMPENGQTFWYKLVEIHADQSRERYGPIQGTAGLQTPTPTPTQSVLGGTATPTPGATSAGTTATPTATAVGGSGPTATPTATSASTSTPIPLPTTGGFTATSTAVAINLPTATAQTIAQTDPTRDQGAYPPPGAVEETVATPSAYPGSDSAYPGVPETETVTGEDLPGSGMEATTLNDNQNPGVVVNPDTPAVIGGTNSNTLPPPGGSAAAARPANAVRGSVIMWAGFIASVLIFSAGLFGSVILFSRQRARRDQ